MSKPKKPNIPNNPRFIPKPANGTVERIPDQQNGQKMVASAYRGPLPSPAMLVEYNSVVPGLAEKIVEWTTDQTAHRQLIESRAVGIDEKLSTWYIVETILGQIFAFLITMAVMAGVIYLAMNDRTAAATALGALGFGGIITAFIVGGRTRTTSEEKPKKPK